MKIKYRCLFCGIPSLFYPPTSEVTPLVYDWIFNFAVEFHGFIIYMTSLFFEGYEPTFPVRFPKGKQHDRFVKYYLR